MISLILRNTEWAIADKSSEGKGPPDRFKVGLIGQNPIVKELLCKSSYDVSKLYFLLYSMNMGQNKQDSSSFCDSHNDLVLLSATRGDLLKVFRFLGRGSSSELLGSIRQNILHNISFHFIC